MYKADLVGLQQPPPLRQQTCKLVHPRALIAFASNLFHISGRATRFLGCTGVEVLDDDAATFELGISIFDTWRNYHKYSNTLACSFDLRTLTVYTCIAVWLKPIWSCM